MKSGLPYILIIGLTGCMPDSTEQACPLGLWPEENLKSANSCGDLKGEPASVNDQEPAAIVCMRENAARNQSSFYWTQRFGIEGGSADFFVLYDVPNHKSYNIEVFQNRTHLGQVHVCTWNEIPGEPGQQCTYVDAKGCKK